MVPSNDGLTQGCPASPVASSFLITLVEEFFWPEIEARVGAEAKEAIDFSVLMDDLTLVTEERFLVDATRLSLRKDSWWTQGSETNSGSARALFIPAERGDWGLWKLEQRRCAARLGGRIAAEALMKEQNDADLWALALEDLIRENDASAAFDSTLKPSTYSDGRPPT